MWIPIDTNGTMIFIDNGTGLTGPISLYDVLLIVTLMIATTGLFISVIKYLDRA